MKRNTELAISELAKGNLILVYDIDGREEEVDLVCLATKCTPKHVYHLRHDAGGLICIAMHHRIAKILGLPFMSEVYSKSLDNYAIFNHIAPDCNAPYGDKPSFSITINHINTYTGITDRDRSLTIREFGLLGTQILMNKRSSIDFQEVFGKYFRTPGHTHLLIANQDLINARQGHTELTVTLAYLGGLSPITVLCEMLDSETERALSIEKAKEFSKKNNLVMIEGVEIIEAYQEVIKN
ncbi:MAG: 3,4-dihydroxy-2-butanone-4-phosphate synthase [Promethearchaeota archaeon]